MPMRIIWGRIRSGEWDRYEAAYRKVFLEKPPAIAGLEDRWLVRDVKDPDAGYSVSVWKSTEAMERYEKSDFFRNIVMPALRPFFVDDFKTSHCDVRVKEHFKA